VPQFIQSGSTGNCWIVACLCAAWCDTCNDYRPPFAALARANPHDGFAWIDIEDESDLLGDIDIENFPTILIARGWTPHFFGTMLPHIEQLQKLLSSVKTNDAPLRDPDPDVVSLAVQIGDQMSAVR
jgi:hypothetical protein